MREKDGLSPSTRHLPLCYSTTSLITASLRQNDFSTTMIWNSQILTRQLFHLLKLLNSIITDWMGNLRTRDENFGCEKWVLNEFYRNRSHTSAESLASIELHSLDESEVGSSCRAKQGRWTFGFLYCYSLLVVGIVHLPGRHVKWMIFKTILKILQRIYKFY